MKGPAAEPGLVTFPGLLRNLPELEFAAAGRGLLTIRPERDGIVRRVPIVMRAEGTIVPSLTLEMLRVVSGSPAILLRTDEAGMQGVALRGFEVPTDGHEQRGAFRPPRQEPFRLREGRARGSRRRRAFPRSLVLVGTSAVGLLDLKTTPTEPAMPGVEVHAQLLESMLAQTVLNSPSYATLAELAIAALVGIAIIALAPVLGAWALFWVGGIMAALLVAVSWYVLRATQSSD